MDPTVAYPLLFVVGSGINTATLAANYTVDTAVADTTSPIFHSLVASGSDRQFILPDPSASLIGLAYVLSNAGTSGGYSWLVKGKTLTTTGTLSSASTIGTSAPGETCYMICYFDGTYYRWKYQVIGATSGAFSGSISAAGAAFTGAVTTTDGVSSGTARKVGGLASNLIASGTLGPTGGTAETALATYTIPANTIKAGTLIKVTAGVIATAETGTTTCTLRCRLGGVSGTLIVGTAAFDLNSADNVQLTASVVGRAAPGAAASVATQGRFEGKMANTGTQVYLVNAPANFATNGALDLVLTGQMSASDANAIACTIFAVEVSG